MARKNKKSAPIYPDEKQLENDPCPNLVVERGPDNRGVGSWVPQDKHRMLRHYVDATRHARGRWRNRVFIDPFCGPGRIQVAGETRTRPGGTVVAYHASKRDAPFTHVFVGDLERHRTAACEERLKAVGAPAKPFPGPAAQTVKEMVAAVPPGSLCTAYIDPYNLELLSFPMLQELAKLRKIDLAINFSTMDLQRNVELEFEPERARFDDVAPGWRQNTQILSASKPNVKLIFFNYWCELIKGLDFEHSEQMPLVRNTQRHPIYRMVFFSRHDFPTGVWDDIARDRQGTIDMF